jgi:sodium pump decarboxylase gamma subunit
MEYSNLFVCLMGMGTVFVGLICIILLIDLMSFLCREKQPAASAPAPTVPAAAAPDTLSPQAVAAVSAAIAEELGNDVSGIRILSAKKL